MGDILPASLLPPLEVSHGSVRLQHEGRSISAPTERSQKVNLCLSLVRIVRYCGKCSPPKGNPGISWLTRCNLLSVKIINVLFCLGFSEARSDVAQVGLEVTVYLVLLTPPSLHHLAGMPA